MSERVNDKAIRGAQPSPEMAQRRPPDLRDVLEAARGKQRPWIHARVRPTALGTASAPTLETGDRGT